MTTGNIGAWQKQVGDSLAPGDVLVEIETDKAQMDFEFQEEGVLAKVLKDSGEKDVAVGSVGLLSTSDFLEYYLIMSSAYSSHGRGVVRRLRLRVLHC